MASSSACTERTVPFRYSGGAPAAPASGSSISERPERPGDSLVEIEADLVVEHESQKAILIGKGGHVVKRIGSRARTEIETILGARVYLALRVKVRKHWRRDDRYVDRLL